MNDDNTKKDNAEKDNTEKRYSIFQNFIYCIKETKKGYAPLLVIATFLILFNALIPVATTFLPKVIIEEITENKELSHLLIITLIMTGGIAVAEGIQKYMDRRVFWDTHRMNTHFLQKVTKKGLTTDYHNQENEHFRYLQSESFESCNGNFSHFTQVYDGTIQLFSNAFGFIVFFGILITLNPFLIVFLLATTVVSFLYNQRVSKWIEANNKEKVSYGQKMQYITEASGQLAAAKDIRLYNMAVWMNQIYEANMNGLKKWYKKYTAKLFGVSTVDSGLSILREGVAYCYLIYMAASRKVSVAEFVLYFNVVTGFSAWLGNILNQVINLNRLNISINRFRSYLEYPETYNREDGASVPTDKHPKKITLENVSFKYEGSEDYIIKNLSLTINPKEHLAVVGLNGAGKTTLVKLICGLTNPTKGRVLYDGVDVREYNREEYYKIFGAVFQDYSILPVKISEIVGEDTAENVDIKRAEECLKKAGLWDKISTLTKGLETNFDQNFWEDGILFSGGETQKLLLARSLYKKTCIEILDEPTAALDPISEERLYEVYDDVMKDKSTVFISHRLASTRFCNRIMLLENGGVLEEGTHEELLKKKGRYYELFETQAKYYRDNENKIKDTDEINDNANIDNISDEK